MNKSNLLKIIFVFINIILIISISINLPENVLNKIKNKHRRKILKSYKILEIIYRILLIIYGIYSVYIIYYLKKNINLITKYYIFKIFIILLKIILLSLVRFKYNNDITDNIKKKINLSFILNVISLIVILLLINDNLEI